MKAVLYTKYGPADALSIAEIEKPTPVDKQVLVKVVASSINASEWRMLENPVVARMVGGGLLKPKNTRLGSDVAGRVEAVGEHASLFKPGDEVFGCANGAFAEYALARETYLASKPVNVTYEQAAAVPVAGLTALQAIRHGGGIHPQEKVAIQGASGGVGSLAIQLARAAGAEVTAIVSSMNLELAKASGADHVVDYQQADFTRNGKEYDLILGINGHHRLAAYKRSLAAGGRYVCVGGSLRQIFESMLLGRWMSRSGDKKLSNMGIARVNREDLVQLAEMLVTGRLHPIIDRSYTLDEIAGAFTYVLEQHPRGKVVIKVT